MRPVGRLIRFCAGYYGMCVASGMVLFCVLPMSLGLATRSMFEAFTRPGGQGGDEHVYAIVGLIAALQLAEVAADMAVSTSWSGWSYQTHTLLQRNLFDGILRGYSRHGLAVSPGDAISRFRDDPVAITYGVMDGVCDLIGRGVFALVAVVVMGSIDPVLTVAAFAPVVVSAALTDALGTRAALYAAKARQSTARLTGFLAEVVGAQLAVRVAGAGPQVIAHLAEVSETRRRRSLRDRMFSEAVNSMNDHLVHIATGAVLLLGAARIRRGAFTIGDFALFVVYLDQLTYLPAEIGRVLTERKRSAVSFDRMRLLMPGDPPDALTAPAQVYLRGAEPPPPAPPPGLEGTDRLERLDVEGLTFHHDGRGRGIDDVSFSVERGTLTVVTGRVGAGKTTLLTVLLGLAAKTTGTISWNGHEVHDPATFFVPPRAAFTPQVPHLFSASLRSNLLLGLPDDDPAGLAEAVRAGVLEADVAGFERGLDTLIGPRGVKLSGGQVQRTAVARMWLRQAELLVFDDVSSALDAETEAELWRRLFDRRGDATCVVVSHSPVALARADQVIVLRDGRVVSP